MKRLSGLLLGVAAAALIGCGDNSVECGEGTQENDDGFCVATGGGTPTCTDGTVLDTATNSCVIDPASCQGGTVLIGGACVDPADDLEVDVTEAVEPNGLGVNGEDSDTPAGEFELKPIGQKVVLQGNINPQNDRNEDGAKEADIDTFLFEVNEATLLDISVDGVGGVAGGFVMFGTMPGFPAWSRFGLNLTGDTAKRQVFLPSAGLYLLAIADTRTLVLGDATGDADNKYYVSIEKKAIPTATALTLTNNEVYKNGTITNGEVAFYSAPLEAGINTVDLQSFDPNFTASLVVNNNLGPRAIANETHSATADAPAVARIGGFDVGQANLIVVDHRINTSSVAVDYRLHVKTRTAKALKADNTTETQNNLAITSTAATVLDDVTYWYFDVNSTNAITGLKLAWSVPVTGVLVDQNGVTVSTFTSLTSTTNRWTGYDGLIRTNAPGRYYFEVFAPAPSAIATPIVATSTITPITATALAFNTPVVDAVPNAFNSNPYTYATGGEPWQLLSLGADAASDGATLRVFTTTSYGRLGTLTTVTAANVATVSQPAAAITVNAGDDATAILPLITLPLPEQLLLTVGTTTRVGTYDLGSSKRDYKDLGTHDGVIGTPYVATHTAEAIALDGENRYFLRTSPGQKVKVEITNVGATVDPAIFNLDYDESDFDDADVGFEGENETYEYTMDSFGWIAFSVVNFGSGAGTYDIKITLTAPAAPYYAAAASTTPWVNICNLTGATDITPANRDDFLTNAVTLPVGFSFFAAADATAVKVSTNGWLTFDTTLVSNAANSGGIPAAFPSVAAPNGVVAPYWEDLANVRICTQTVGTKFYVQWRGNVYGDASQIVAAQAILDTSNDSIEFVYAPYLSADTTTASAGVESSTGSQGTSVFAFDEVDLAGTSVKLTHQ